MQSELASTMGLTGKQNQRLCAGLGKTADKEGREADEQFHAALLEASSKIF